METQTDLLVGARVSTHQKTGTGAKMKPAEARITAFKWMPAETGTPQLVAVVMFDDGSVDWRFLQYVRVLYPEGVQP